MVGDTPSLSFPSLLPPWPLFLSLSLLLWLLPISPNMPILPPKTLSVNLCIETNGPACRCSALLWLFPSTPRVLSFVCLQIFCWCFVNPAQLSLSLGILPWLFLPSWTSWLQGFPAESRTASRQCSAYIQTVFCLICRPQSQELKNTCSLNPVHFLFTAAASW